MSKGGASFHRKDHSCEKSPTPLTRIVLGRFADAHAFA